MNNTVRILVLVVLVGGVTVMSLIVTSHCYPAVRCDAECQQRRARQWDWTSRSPVPP